ncbi:hypothetical protein IFM89_028816 [Coptis chinensis]|uniref:Pentatricopeptide repeat-containing protein n=1 Tax=Coptis chinensis TaxID=261450 RepID=A0A835LJQ8_9MAGN|nr:hypothetical protein IFM89_028816 [Coptis chinensis]
MRFWRAGELNNAMKLFEQMPARNRITWNTMLTILVQSNNLNESRRLFLAMPKYNSTSYTLMITAFSRGGFVEEAREVFEAVPVYYKNVILWTAMVSCYAHNNQPMLALEFFKSSYEDFFKLKVVPNSYTFSIVLKACMDMRSLVFAMQAHGLVVKVLNGDLKDIVFVQNSLIDVHSKLGNLADAEKIFNGLMFKDLSSWNIIMDAYARRRFIDKALRVFNSMSEKDTLSYNIMISGLAESGYGIEALELFLQLLHSQSPQIKPNMSTYTTVLTVCATFTMLEFGVQIHGLLRKCGIVHSNIYTDNSLINMYAKCGSIEEMQRLFTDMPKRDIVSWNSVILGLGQNGYTRKALDVAEQVLKLGVHNGSTFVALLTSCSHGGFVDEGMEYFNSMVMKYGVHPSIDHHNCVIDMLGRAGQIAEAYDFLHKMPFTPNVVTWAALLSAALAHNNEEIGEIAAHELQVLEPSNAANYVMLAKLYGCTDQVERSGKIFSLMSKIGLTRGQAPPFPGEVGAQAVAFWIAGDQLTFYTCSIGGLGRVSFTGLSSSKNCVFRHKSNTSRMTQGQEEYHTSNMNSPVLVLARCFPNGKSTALQICCLLQGQEEYGVFCGRHQVLKNQSPA